MRYAIFHQFSFTYFLLIIRYSQTAEILFVFCFVTKVFSVSKLLSRFITCAAVDLFVLSESKSSLCNL